MTTDNQNTQVTDGFHLVIDALKANDLDTIFGLVGIPITDLCRLAQAEGMRFIGFRHEFRAVFMCSPARIEPAWFSE